MPYPPYEKRWNFVFTYQEENFLGVISDWRSQNTWTKRIMERTGPTGFRALSFLLGNRSSAIDCNIATMHPCLARKGFVGCAERIAWSFNLTTHRVEFRPGRTCHIMREAGSSWTTPSSITTCQKKEKIHKVFEWLHFSFLPKRCTTLPFLFVC